MKFTEKLFGTHSERELKRIYPIVDKIEALRPTMQALTDEELRAKTKEYKDRYNGGESLDSILPEAFATVREAAKRSLGMEHHRVQLIGGIILHQGRIAEMKTGEGKTLVACVADRTRRPHRYRQRLPGKPRCRVDGKSPQIPRSDRRRRFK